MNTNDADWVEDVRRWYFNGGRSASAPEPRIAARTSAADLPDVGYEAAHPSLQSAGWPKPAASGFGTLG